MRSIMLTVAFLSAVTTAYARINPAEVSKDLSHAHDVGTYDYLSCTEIGYTEPNFVWACRDRAYCMTHARTDGVSESTCINAREDARFNNERDILAILSRLFARSNADLPVPILPTMCYGTRSAHITELCAAMLRRAPR